MKKHWMILIIVVVFIGGAFFLFQKKEKMVERWLRSETPTVSFYDDSLQEIKKVARGIKVQVLTPTKKKEEVYHKIKYKDEEFYVKESALTEHEKDFVLEKKVFVRTPATLYSDIKEGIISGLAKKGDALEITGYDGLKEDGSVEIYHTKEGSIYGKYVVFQAEEALKVNEEYASFHKERGNTLGGGGAEDLDYYPYEKANFEDNVMPSQVYALYLNNHANTILHVDDYIAYAKTTKINAFVIDIKDNCSPGYSSSVMKKYSQTNDKNALNSYDDYKKAIQKIKDAGFYTIGRITVFKDEYYALDHKEHAITDTRTKKPFYYNDTYWPSPYQRDVWMFNVALAKEAVLEMGFQEIQFDYVSFPDRSSSFEKQGFMDFKNEFQEEKAQAIQRFVAYATDELHKVNAYVSIDVFGESAYTYVTAYGQYFAAISNIADVISGMPYPDHFSRNTFGIPEPWKDPYGLLTIWANYVKQRQKEIPTPAKVRTWIAAYDSIIDGTVYNGPLVSKQIQALFDVGLTGGYMTWNSSSNLEKYKQQKDAYSKEY